MPIQCKMINADEIRPKDRKQGDMFYADWLVDENTGKVHGISKQYEKDWKGKRPPIVVILPDNTSFMVDSCYMGDLEKQEGWIVTGEAPNITVSPSINCIGHYHGWLQNGVLSDDVEGRKY